MAAVDILTLTNDLAQAFDTGQKLVQSRNVNIQQATGKTDPVAVTAPQETFVLNGQWFTDLQVYLSAAEKLPPTNERFEAMYPKADLDEYLKRGGATLYDNVRDVLVSLSSGCAKFKSSTVPKMNTIAMNIVNYADEANKNGLKLYGLLQVITQPDFNLDANKPIIEEAIGLAADLGDAARGRRVECEAMKQAFFDFKTKTELDKGKLQEVDKKTDQYLPKPSELSDALKTAMTQQTKSLTDLAKLYDAQKYKESGYRRRTPLCFDLDGLVVPGEQDSSYSGPMTDLSKAKKAYNDALAGATRQRVAIVTLRQNCSLLSAQIDQISAVIDNAITAMGGMATGFSQLESDLLMIAEKLDAIKSAVTKASDTLRARALLRFQEATDKWARVKALAGDFAKNSMMKTISVPAGNTVPIDPAPKEIQVHSAHWGGRDVTPIVQIVSYNGADARIITTATAYPDSWPGVEKTLSVLFSYDGEKRVLSTREYSGTYDLIAGPWEKQTRYIPGIYEVNLIQALPAVLKPSGCSRDIIAIVWGWKVCTDTAVWAKAYDAFMKGTEFDWSNAGFNGLDGWPGHKKTGVIYYTTDGGLTVKSWAGVEFSKKKWDT